MFRYYKAQHALSVLRDLEIRSSIPNTLNDPFELSPKVDASQFSRRRIEAFLREHHNIEEAYQQHGRRLGLSSRKEFKRYYLRGIPERATALLVNVPRNAEAVRRNFLDTFSKHWRLICGSQTRESILMWSHYADNHTGIAIEFDTSLMPFAEMCEYIFPVSYSITKPVYVHRRKYRDFHAEMFNVATTKAAEWSYERELRIIIPAVSSVLRDLQYLSITAESITTVSVGCRASAPTIAAVQAALKGPKMSHVRLLQAQLDRDEYQLNFDSMSETH